MLFGPNHPNFESYEDYLQLSAALTRLFSSKPGKTPHLDPKWLALFRLSVDGWLVSTGKSLNHKVFS